MLSLTIGLEKTTGSMHRLVFWGTLSRKFGQTRPLPQSWPPCGKELLGWKTCSSWVYIPHSSCPEYQDCVTGQWDTQNSCKTCIWNCLYRGSLENQVENTGLGWCPLVTCEILIALYNLVILQQDHFWFGQICGSAWANFGAGDRAFFGSICRADNSQLGPATGQGDSIFCSSFVSYLHHQCLFSIFSGHDKAHWQHCQEVHNSTTAMFCNSSYLAVSTVVFYMESIFAVVDWNASSEDSGAFGLFHHVEALWYCSSKWQEICAVSGLSTGWWNSASLLSSHQEWLRSWWFSGHSTACPTSVDVPCGCIVVLLESHQDPGSKNWWRVPHLETSILPIVCWCSPGYFYQVHCARWSGPQGVFSQEFQTHWSYHGNSGCDAPGPSAANRLLEEHRHFQKHYVHAIPHKDMSTAILGLQDSK